MFQILRIVSLLLPLLTLILNSGSLARSLLLPQNWPAAVLIVVLCWKLRPVVHAVWTWRLPSTLLLLATVLLLPAMAVLDSDWLAAAGFAVGVCLLTLLAGLPNRGRVLLLLVMFTGLPPMPAVFTMQQLSQRLLLHSSTLASSLQYWHFTEGTTAGTLSASVDLSGILQSPFGLTGVLVLTTLLLFRAGRTLPQVLLTLPLAVICSLPVYFCACLFAILDISDGSQLVPVQGWPLLMLLPGCLLLWSMQYIVLFLTAPVLQSDRPATSHISGNPLNRLWGREVSGVLPEKWSEIQLRSSDGNRLPIGRFLQSFMVDWALSREVSMLYFAIPGSTLLLAALLVEQRIAGDVLTVGSLYTNRLLLAEQQGDLDSQQLCLQALAGLQPNDLARRMQVAEFLWQHRSQQAGWEAIERLASLDTGGYGPAHLWIVRNALSNQPFQKQTTEQLITRLQRALETGHTTAEAHRMLSQLYLTVDETGLAERHLRQAAEADAEYADALIYQLARNGRLQPHDVLVERRLVSLESKLKQKPKDSELRLRLSYLLALTGEASAAESLLDTGLQLDPSPALRKATAELRLQRVQQLLQADRMEGDAGPQAVREALQLDPQNPQAPLLASLLHLKGAPFTGSAEAALQYWLAQSAGLTPDKSETIPRCVVHLAYALGNYTQAAETYQRLRQPDRFDSMIWLAALVAAGRQSEAAQAVTEITQPLLQTAELSARIQAAEYFSVAREFSQASSSLQLEVNTASDTEQLNTAQARIALQEFDVLTGYPGAFSKRQDTWTPQFPESASERLTELLDTSLKSSSVIMRVADRLYLMSLRGGQTGQVASETLQRLQATGDATRVLSVIGTRALQNQRTDQAVQWLRLAVTASRKPDPFLMNNLALALIRTGDPEHQSEALRLATAAVQLLPDNHDLLTTRAEVFLATGSLPQALRDLQRARELRPDVPETFELLARVCRAQGDDAGAEEHLQKALKIRAERR